MSIKIKLEGFESLLTDIQAANGSIDKACDSAIRQGAQIMRQELKQQMTASNVPKDLIERMPASEIEVEGNRFSARVGYKKGAYDPENPSDGYKVVFLNYGTPHRAKYGQLVAKGFIQIAKKTATPKIRKSYKKAFNTILERLKK